MIKLALKNKVVKNFSILTISNLLIQVLSILSSIRLARELQPAGYGLFNLISVQASVFSIIAAYGLRIVIIRHIARKRDDARKIFKLSNNIRFVTTFIAIVVAIIYNLLQPSAKLSVVLLISLSVLIVFQTFWDTIESLSFGFEKMEATGIINFVFTIIWVCEVYILPKASFTVTILVYTYVLNQLLKSLVYYWWINKSILKKQPTVGNMTFNDHKELILQSNFYFILAVFTAVQNQLPVLFLQFNSTMDQIGLFNLGYRIISPLQMVLNVLLTALFPMFSRLAIEDRELFGKRIKTLLNIIIFIGIWGCLCFALFSKDVVHLLYGVRYLVSVKVIIIQCWYTVLFAIFCIIGTVLNSLDKQKLLSIISIISGVIATPIFYYQSRFGAIGLAWAFVITAFVNMTYPWAILLKLVKNQISITYTILIFSILGILVWSTSYYSFEWSFIIRLGISIILTFVIFYYLYKIEFKKLNATAQP